ncbi:hypothetical protein K470DRAFT_260437 [Piedraia hortae CBS 480.64]|uniref:Polynucleotide 5'-hydroxyl-kinase GRC3 n=1 Tax=Piedraia hortae CBS 480.64 TaxID=1314780 RepID=A0A6A7BR99_9PEZI|nr:hypothetical protein K470DRAFT_260437 [Piedraia hortae CBS 480.64]
MPLASSVLPADQALTILDENDYVSDKSEDAIHISRLAVTLSSCRPESIQENAKFIQASLNEGEFLTCVGIYDLRVDSGLATVYGAIVHPGHTYRVFCPSICALPSVEARKNDTVIEIAHADPGLCRLEQLSPLFGKIWTDQSEGISFFPLSTSAEDPFRRLLTPLLVERTVQQVLAKLAAEARYDRPQRTISIGAKSSGKSTFNRMLCNTLLSGPSAKVTYLDLDPGQPEFGPPGQLSLVEVTTPLLGPSWTHLASSQSHHHKLLRCHTIAANTFKDGPSFYLACARDLVRHADTCTPLVVNTCGWTNGLGGDVLTDLVHIVKATDLVDFEVEEMEELKSLPISTYRLPRQPPRPTARTPAELRSMQTISSFHRKGEKWSARPLSEVRPWLVSYSQGRGGVHAVVSLGPAPGIEFLAELLSGSIVAVITVEDDVPTVDQRSPEGIPSSGAALNPERSCCHGLALVRAVDHVREELQLIVSLSDKEMLQLCDKQVVLARGTFDAPEWAYLEDVYLGKDGEGYGPWVSRREGVGVEGAIWRLRHPPMMKR